MRRFMHLVREEFPILLGLAGVMTMLSPSTLGKVVGCTLMAAVVVITLIEIWRDRDNPRP